MSETALSTKRSSLEQDEQDKNLSTVHFLPCTIDFDGPVPVNSFFQVQRAKTELKASFRGRELIGKEMKLPTNVLGVNAIQNRPKEASETSWDCVGQFDKITVWQHDVAPDLGQLQECIDWFEIAEQVHSV
eukprot:GDKK01036678.1.p1 GENE.GDKK01036678.1~~GDKK01036678.1.p1  ORF type:complete len:131 (-),score=10.83 GDKK01036678.1:149-541(-)